MKVVELPKTDVKTFLTEELKELASLRESAALPLLSKVCEDFVKSVLESAMQTSDDTQKLKFMDAAYYMRNSFAFLLDAPDRALEELKTRVDTDKDND